MRATHLLCIVSSETNPIINTPWAAARGCSQCSARIHATPPQPIMDGQHYYKDLQY